MSLAPGTRLGPYEIVGPIGAGGMGEVYRARDTRLVSRLLPNEIVLQWGADGRSLYVGTRGTSMSVSRIDLDTGQRAPWRTFSVPDPAGTSFVNAVLTPDGRSYAYSYCRVLDDLYLVTGLK